MNARLKAVAAALNRARRRAGLDRNPMRRREDHIQTAVGLVLTVVFLATAPLAAVTMGGRVYSSELHTEHLQTAQRHPVTATVTGTVTDPAKEPSHAAIKTLKVLWRDPQGTLRSADYWGTTTEVGATTTIWVDRSGHIVPPPHKHAQTIADTTMTAIGVPLAILSVLVSAYALLRRRLDRSRYRLWDASWAWSHVKWGQRGSW